MLAGQRHGIKLESSDQIHRWRKVENKNCNEDK